LHFKADFCKALRSSPCTEGNPGLQYGFSLFSSVVPIDCSVELQLIAVSFWQLSDLPPTSNLGHFGAV